MLNRYQYKENEKTKWHYALLFALPVSGVILAQFYYWFAIADRYLVFLYFHDMGPLVTDTSPFSRVTASRYWMAGLVACGMIMLLYTFANWILGRSLKSYHPPSWKPVWIIAALILSIGIPAITMSVNYPRLPASLAIFVTLSTLLSLALSLMPGALAVRQPLRLAWLFADGWGIALLLWAMPHLIYVENWIHRGFDWRVLIAVLMLLVACIWLIFLSIIEAWRHTVCEKIVSLVLAGFCVCLSPGALITLCVFLRHKPVHYKQ